MIEAIKTLGIILWYLLAGVFYLGVLIVLAGILLGVLLLAVFSLQQLFVGNLASAIFAMMLALLMGLTIIHDFRLN
jgi:hypothetical protein